MLNFREFSLGDKPLFEELCRKYPSPGCERCFAVAYVWRIFFDYRVADWNGRLVIFEKSNGWLMYPLGEATPPEDLFRLVCEVEACGFKVSSVYDIPPGYFDAYPNAKDFFELKLEEKYFDYLYNAADIFELKGPLLKKKRNHIKHFTSENPGWTCEDLCAGNTAEARAFMEAMECDSETAAISCAFDNFDVLGWGGVALKNSSGKIVAAALICKINDEVFDVSFEKSDKSCEGAAQMIVKLEAQYILSKGGRIMNREQDMGLENLRHAKRSLDPFMFERGMLYPAGARFSVRKIDPKDTDILGQVLSLYSLSGWFDGEDADIPRQVESIVKNSYCFFGAFDGVRLAGFFRALSDGVSDAYLLDLFVDPQFRGMGAGKKLCAHITNFLFSKGVSYITCISTPEGRGVYGPMAKVMDTFTPFKF